MGFRSIGHDTSVVNVGWPIRIPPYILHILNVDIQGQQRFVMVWHSAEAARGDWVLLSN